MAKLSATALTVSSPETGTDTLEVTSDANLVFE